MNNPCKLERATTQIEEGTQIPSGGRSDKEMLEAYRNYCMYLQYVMMTQQRQNEGFRPLRAPQPPEMEECAVKQEEGADEEDNLGSKGEESKGGVT